MRTALTPRARRLCLVSTAALLVWGCTSMVASSPEGTVTSYVEESGVRVYAPRAARAQKVVFDTTDEQLIHARDTPLRRFFDSHAHDFNGPEGLAKAKSTILKDIVYRLRNREYVRAMIRDVISRHADAISTEGAKDEKSFEARRSFFARLLEDALHQALIEANYPDIRDSALENLLEGFTSDWDGGGGGDPRRAEHRGLWRRTTIEGTSGKAPKEVEDFAAGLLLALRERTYFKHIIDQASAKRLDVFRQRGNALEPRTTAIKAFDGFMGRLSEAYGAKLALPAIEAWFAVNENKTGFKPIPDTTERAGFLEALRIGLKDQVSKGASLAGGLKLFLADRGQRLHGTLLEGHKEDSEARKRVREALELAVEQHAEAKAAVGPLKKSLIAANKAAEVHKTKSGETSAAVVRLESALKETRTQSASARAEFRDLGRDNSYVKWLGDTTVLATKLGEPEATPGSAREAIAGVTSLAGSSGPERTAIENELQELTNAAKALKKEAEEVHTRLRATDGELEGFLVASDESQRAANYPQLPSAARVLRARAGDLPGRIASLKKSRSDLATALDSFKTKIEGLLLSKLKENGYPNYKAKWDAAWGRLEQPSWGRSGELSALHFEGVRLALAAMEDRTADPRVEELKKVQEALPGVSQAEAAEALAKRDSEQIRQTYLVRVEGLVKAMTPALSVANGKLPASYRQDVSALVDRARRRLRESLDPYAEGIKDETEAKAAPGTIEVILGLPAGNEDERLLSIELSTDQARDALAANLEAVFSGYEDVVLSKSRMVVAFFEGDHVAFTGKSGQAATAKAVGDTVKASLSVAKVREEVGNLFNTVKVLETLKPTSSNDDVVHAFRTELYHAFKDRLPEVVQSERAVDYSYWWLTLYPKAMPLGKNTMEGQSVIEVSFPERVVPKEQYHRWLQDRLQLPRSAGVRTRGTLPQFGPDEAKRKVASDTLTGFLTVMRAPELAGRHPEVLQAIVTALNLLTGEGGSYEGALNYLRCQIPNPKAVETADLSALKLYEAFGPGLSKDQKRDRKRVGREADQPAALFDAFGLKASEGSGEEGNDSSQEDTKGPPTKADLNSELKETAGRLSAACEQDLCGLLLELRDIYRRAFARETGTSQEIHLSNEVERLLDRISQRRVRELLCNTCVQPCANPCPEAKCKGSTERKESAAAAGQPRWPRVEASTLLAKRPFGIEHVVLALRSAVEDELPLPAKTELYLNAYFDGVDRFAGVGQSSYVYPFPANESVFILRDFLRELGLTSYSVGLVQRRLRVVRKKSKRGPEELLRLYETSDGTTRREIARWFLRNVRYRAEQEPIEAMRHLELWFLEKSLFQSQASLYRLVAHGFYTNYPAVPNPDVLQAQFLKSEGHLRALIYQWVRPLWLLSQDQRDREELRGGKTQATRASREKTQATRAGREEQQGRVSRFLDALPLTKDVRRSLIESLSDQHPEAKGIYAWLDSVYANAPAMDQLKTHLLKHLYSGLWASLGELAESRRRPVSFPGLKPSQYDGFLHWGRAKLQPGIQIIDLLPASRDDLIGISVNEGGVVARAAAQGEGAAAYDINELALLQRNAQMLGKSLRQGGVGVSAVTTESGPASDYQRELSRLATQNRSLGYNLGGSARGSVYARARAAMAYARRREYLDAVITAAGRGDNFAKWVVRKGDLRSDQAGTDASKLVAAAHNGYPNGDQPFHLLVKIPNDSIQTDWRGKRYILFNSAYAATSRTPLEADGGWLGWLAKGFSYLLHPPLVESEESWVVGTVYPFKWDVHTFEGQQELLRRPNSLGGRIYLDTTDKVHYSKVRELIEAEAGFIKTTRALQSQHLSEVMKQIEEEAKEEHQKARDVIEERRKATSARFEDAK